jgi:hypothetical protein
MTRSSSPFVTSAAEEEEEVKKLRRMEGENAGGASRERGALALHLQGLLSITTVSTFLTGNF